MNILLKFLIFHLGLVMPLIANAKVIPVKVSFDKESYDFTVNEKNEIVITSHDIRSFYSDDTCAPALPLVNVNVLAPHNMRFSGLRFNSHKTLLMENVTIPLCPIPIPTDGSMDSFVDSREPNYELRSYPEDVVVSAGEFFLAGNRIIKLMISPFEYDAASQDLYFNDNFEIDVELDNCEEIDTVPVRHHMDDIINRIVINPIDPPGEGYDTVSYFISPHVEYAIITCDSLKEAFQPLADWKITKGLRTKVYTTEYIYEHYSGATPQQKIKRFIKDFYEHHKTKYVLLGGDDTIVPAQGCYAVVNQAHYDLPTDLFYACLRGTFDWNANGNDKIGERQGDGVVDAIDVDLTRMPARTVDDVTAMVNKTLYYEKTPKANGWSNKVLLSGKKIASYTSTPTHLKSDAEIYCDNLYETSFAPNWSGSRFRFYDTFTDAPDSSFYQLSKSNLLSEMQNRYAFMEMITHGSEKTWQMEVSPSFSRDEALNMQCAQPLLISTLACSTNAFDSADDPCLSEAFLRNPNNGVYAYWGCSREGFLGSGTQYDKIFFNTLLTLENNSFGHIVTEAKASGLSTDQYRQFLYYCYNGMGDAETPIFTTIPQEFDNVIIELTMESDDVTIYTGESDCKVCSYTPGRPGAVFGMTIMGDTALYDIRENVSQVQISVMDTTTVCITKKNFIPCVLTLMPYNEELPRIAHEGGGVPRLLVNGRAGLTDITSDGFTITGGGDAIELHSSSPGELHVYNLSGQSVLTLGVCRGVNTVDLTHCPRGIYILTLNGNTQKIIK